MNKRLVAVFFLSLVTDYLASWNGYAIAHRDVLAAGLASFALPLANFFCVFFFIEEKTMLGRFKITLTVALACGIGSVLMLKTVGN